MSLTPESLGWEFPRGGTLDFVSAGRQNREYSATVSTFDWDNFYDRFGGGHFFDALRDDMKAHYDYVLIDSRTGLSDIADICTVHLRRTCSSTASPSATSPSTAPPPSPARSPSATPAAPSPSTPCRCASTRARRRRRTPDGRSPGLKFDRLPRNLTGDELTAYWGAVEIPYRPYYAYEETLATFGDEAGLTNSLLSAFERLTAVVTDREVTSMPPVGEEVRLRMHATPSPGAGPPCPPISTSATWRRTGCGPTRSSPSSPGPASGSSRATSPPTAPRRSGPSPRRRTPHGPWCCSPAPT
ncbi:hypothetical protein SCALM49S_01403 [Streptomyces californicus]